MQDLGGAGGRCQQALPAGALATQAPLRVRPAPARPPGAHHGDHGLRLARVEGADGHARRREREPGAHGGGGGSGGSCGCGGWPRADLCGAWRGCACGGGGGGGALPASGAGTR